MDATARNMERLYISKNAYSRCVSKFMKISRTVLKLQILRDLGHMFVKTDFSKNYRKLL